MEVITKHVFTSFHGCRGLSACDWGECSCTLYDECKFCHTHRAEKTTEKDDEMCPGRPKAEQKKYEYMYKLLNPLTPAVKGTDLKREQMVYDENYLASDFTSVPDCTWGSDCKKKLEGSTLFKLLFSGEEKDSNLNIGCDKCICSLDIKNVK